MVDLLGERMPRFSEEEAGMVKGSADLFAINIYTGSYVEEVWGEGGDGFESDGRFATHCEEGGGTGGMGGDGDGGWYFERIVTIQERKKDGE